MAFDFKAVEITANEDFITRQSKNEWCDLLKCSKEKLESLIDGEDNMLHFPEDKPLFALNDKLEKEHVLNENPSCLFMLPIATYPSYIYSPLRILNKWDSEFFYKAVDGLEKIITKGDMTFIKIGSLGLSEVDELHPFVLSRRKADVIITLVDGKIFDSVKKEGTLSQDGFACYLHYEILGRKYPVIMIDSEDLESACNGAKDREAEIIKAYQFDILEMFAHSIREVYPNAYTGRKIHFAFDFALQYMKNFGTSVDVYYKTVQHFFDVDENVYIKIDENDLNALHAEVEKKHQGGELTEEELESGIYGEGIVDIIDWEKKYIRFDSVFGMKKYENPVSVDLKHPYTLWALK